MLCVLYVRVGGTYYVIIICILLRYTWLLYRWRVYLRLLHDRYLVWLYLVSPCLFGLGVSGNVRLVIILPLLTHPLWPSRMLRWHPRRLGALQVFWTCSKKLVKCFYNLSCRFLKIYVLPARCIIFPGKMHNITTISGSNRLPLGLEVDERFVCFRRR